MAIPIPIPMLKIGSMMEPREEGVEWVAAGMGLVQDRRRERGIDVG